MTMGGSIVKIILMQFKHILHYINITWMLLILFTLLIILIVYFFWKNYALPPGPWGLPIFGYLPWLDAKNPYVTLTNLSKKYGSVYGLSLGSVYTVVLTDPKIIKYTFSKDSTTGRAPLYLTHGIFNGYGLICAQGELWKEHRRFTFSCLRQFGATKIGSQRKKMESLIMDYSLDFVKYLETQGEKIAIDIFPALRHSVGSAVNLIVFGKAWDRDNETWKWLQHLQEEGPKYLGVAGPLNFLPFFRFFPKYQKIMNFIKNGIRKTHEVYKKIIAEQFALLDKKNNDGIGNVAQAFILEKSKKPDDIAEKLYNDTQFCFLLGDLFGAGLDTTVTTLRWYFLFLGKNPSLQQEIRRELNEVLLGRLPTMEDITHLPLMEASILETMRIRPVVPIGMPHGTLEEIDIEGFKVPKGTMLVPLQWALHMDETVWKNPETFNPKRFINDEGKIVKPENFMPFQIGKRMCVGDELARMMLFLFISTFLQRFSFEISDPDLDLNGECGITLTPYDHKFYLTKIGNTC